MPRARSSCCRHKRRACAASARRTCTPSAIPTTGSLAAQEPAAQGTFEKNRQAFLARLNDRIIAWDAALKGLRGTKVVVVHDSWAYFAERFGLNIVAAAEPSPGVTPSPAELAQLFKRMREANVGLVIADPHTNPALVQQITERAGARSVTLLPSAPDYIGLFEENVRRLSLLLNPG
jgi:ABC-type Zn uptake system ZnuABC Zn-binding protein ZnuA